MLPSAEKKNYAQRLSNGLAQVVANALRDDFPDVTPTADGAGQESTVTVDKGQKRLDVKVSDSALGLILSVSIKTYSFQTTAHEKEPGSLDEEHRPQRPRAARGGDGATPAPALLSLMLLCSSL